MLSLPRIRKPSEVSPFSETLGWLQEMPDCFVLKSSTISRSPSWSTSINEELNGDAFLGPNWTVLASTVLASKLLEASMATVTVI